VTHDAPLPHPSSRPPHLAALVRFALAGAFALGPGPAGAGGPAPSAGCPSLGARYETAGGGPSTFLGDVATDGAGAVYLATTRSYPGFVERVGVERLDANGAAVWSAEWQRAGGSSDRAELAAADAAGVTVAATSFLNPFESATAVVRFDGAGEKAWEAAFHPTLRDTPWSLRGDGAGGALVSGFDDDGWFLVRFGADGAQLWAAHSAGRFLARGIGVDAAGNAYFGGVLEDEGAARVLRVSPAGAVNGSFDYAAAEGERFEGVALAVTPAGDVRLALGVSTFVQLPEDPPGLLGSQESYRVVGFAPDGSLAFEQDVAGTAETSGIDGWGVPTHAALDAAGNLLVTGSVRRYSAYAVPLHKFAPDGALLWSRMLLPLLGNVPRARELELDAGGAALVAAEGSFVARVEADGTVAWMHEPVGGTPAATLAPGAGAFMAVTLPPKKKRNQVELVRLDAPAAAPAGRLVAKKKLAFKKVFSNHASRPTKIKNKSRFECLAVEVETSGPPFVAAGTLVLPPRGRAQIFVALAPESGEDGPFEGALRLLSSDPAAPLREVRLSGER
jgi:hypothetical protein